jgi:hypothetical protein
VTYQTGFVASAARTTNGSSAVVAVPANVDNLAFLVNCTASSGTTPNLAIAVQWSNDGTTWAAGDPADGFTALTTTGVVVKAFAVKASQARLSWTITGTTPSFTFSADVRWADHAV